MQHVFTNQGSQLRWRATFDTPREDISAHLYNITIAYEHTQPPSQPNLDNPGDTAVSGDILLTWAASTDPDGSIDHYELQSSNEDGFSIGLATYTTTGTSYNVTASTDGVFFFRVRAVDNDDVYSLWSNIESITIASGLPPPPPSSGFPIEAISLVAILALGISVYYDRRMR